MDESVPEATMTGEYPPALKDMEIWVAWQLDSVGRKRPRAPWITDHCYPVSWGSDAVPRPETDFETVQKYTGLLPNELESMGLAFPDDDPERKLHTGLILPHEPPDPPVMQIDLDDVRRPETGEIHPDAKEIINRAGSYASVSTSGEGVHCMVRAGLPPGKGKHIGELDSEPWVGDEVPQVELYDHGRHVALTGEYLDGTPLELNTTQETVDWILEEYPDDSSAQEQTEKGVEDYLNGIQQDNSSGMSGYFTRSLPSFAPPRANETGTSQGIQGAHPSHGGTSTPDSESSNYHIHERKNVWHCFAHSSGGGPLTMAAVLSGELQCRDCTGRNPLDDLSDLEYLKVCVTARDKHGFSGDPPYRALKGVAKATGLVMKDGNEGVLGRSAYTIARKMYDSTTKSDVTEWIAND